MNHFHLRNDNLESHEIASKKEKDTLAGINWFRISYILQKNQISDAQLSIMTRNLYEC